MAHRIAGVLLVLVVCLGALPAAADDLETAKRRREEVRGQRAALAAQLDVLGADEAALVAALDALQAQAVAEQAALVEARREAAAAREAAGRASVEVSRVDVRLRDLRDLLVDLAVDAYIGDEGVLGEVALFVGSEDGGEAAKTVYLADLEVARQDAIATDLAQQADRLDEVRAAAAVAAGRAARTEEEVVVRVAAAEEARDEQATFVAAVEAELERRLAEAAGLEQLDQQLSADIMRGEAELAARLRAEAEAAARAAAEQEQAAAALRAQTALQQGGGQLGPLAPVPDGRAPSLARPPSGRIVRVGGINVDSTIAEPLAALLAAAAADGLALGGGGYRDSAAQLERRAANCGTTHHDLYERPASQCRPPTARPGHSMHERGLAVDFTLDGALIGTTSNRGYRWLAANAARFGLYNLPGEPWHWSTDGR